MVEIVVWGDRDDGAASEALVQQLNEVIRTS